MKNSIASYTPRYDTQKILLRIFCVLCMSGIFGTKVHAAECPDFTKIPVTSDEVIAKIDACIDARKNGNPNSITDYSCPSGEYSLEDGRPFTDERLAQIIAANILMNEVDKNVKKYMQDLQDTRSKDAVAWTQNIWSCLLNNTHNTTVRDAYSKICDFSYIMHFLNTNSQNRILISTTAAYPQATCTLLAKKKIDAWTNLGINLMHDGVNKSYQNDSDEFFSNVKWAYKRVLDKFHNYQKILTRAVSKIDAYIRNPVQ